MANITPDYLRGFLIPSISISKDNLWDAQSSYTQGNARAGIPEAQSAGVNLTLSSIGSQGEEIKVETIQGGLPGEALFKWSGEDSVDLGRDAAHILTEAGFWKYSASPSSARYLHSDCVSSLDGTMWVVSERDNLTNINTIEVSRQEKSGAITSLNTFISLPGTFSSDGLPCITRLQDGSLLVAYFQYTVQDEINIKVHRSIDNGDTWQEIAPRGLAESIDSTTYEPKKMKMVSIDNTVSLFIELETSNRNRLAQYVSRDGGTTFLLVNRISSSTESYFHEPSPVSLPDGTIGLAYISDSTELNFTKIPNPGIRLSSSEWTAANERTISLGTTFSSITSNVMSGGEVAAWFQDGIIWVVAQEYGRGRLIAFYSDNMGTSWRYASGGTSTVSNGYILDYESNANRVTGLSACTHEGRTKILAHNTNSIWYLALGGYSSFSFPPRVDSPSRYEYLVWESTYIPVMLPAVSSQYTTIGAGTQALDGEGLKIETSGNARYYRYAHSGGYFDEGQVVRIRLQVDQNTSGVTADYIYLEIEQDDTVNSLSLKLRFSPSTIQVRDKNGTLATISHDMTESTEIVIAITDTDAKIWYRTADGAQAKKWNLESITGIAKGGTGAGNNIEWGHKSFSGVLTYRSHWQEVSISSGEQAGQFRFDLRGATYPPLGEYQYIDGGLAITSKDAPARGEDEYKISPRFDYGIENIFHGISLSPRVVWRSKADTALQRIPLFIDPVVASTDKSMGLSDMLGVHLSNINFREFILESWSGSSWVTLASVDTSEGFQGKYLKKGNTLISNDSTKQFLLQYGEAIGWRAELSNGDDTTVIVKIRMNSEGIWSTDSTVKQAILQYDTDLTDPSTIPASGNIKLIPDSITFLKNRLDGVNLGQYALSINIPIQATLEGYFQIGSLLMGSVAFPAPQYQRGRTITYTPNIQSQSSLDGMFFSRKMSAGRRTASIAWTEPIDTTRLYDLNPDYWQVSSTAGAQPVANYGDPYLMNGIFRYLSNREPLVYLPSIPKNPTNNQVLLNHREEHMLARTTGEVSVESVIGEERVDEMFRVATVNLEEIE